MKVYEIVFSPTGGTKRVAEYVAQAISSDIISVDLSESDFKGYDVDKESLAVIAMPSFGGRAPKIAVDRLKMIHTAGAKAVAIAVYGNREQEDTLIEMVDVAKECGFKIVAGITAVAEHSIAHQYATGRPDVSDEKQLQQFAKQIVEKMNDSSDSDIIIPGNRPYKKAGAGITPRTSSACIECGTCAVKCPVAAIDATNPKKTDKDICINCMRCISICPKGARTANAMMVNVVGMALKKACSERKENMLYI